jgi:transcriptional regulator with XRE-family HTH domain
MDSLELKIRRIQAGLQQYEVAARVGIPATKLCEIETGRRQPTPEFLDHIMAVIEEAHRAKAQ